MSGKGHGQIGIPVSQFQQWLTPPSKDIARKPLIIQAVAELLNIHGFAEHQTQARDSGIK